MKKEKGQVSSFLVDLTQFEWQRGVSSEKMSSRQFKNIDISCSVVLLTGFIIEKNLSISCHTLGSPL